MTPEASVYLTAAEEALSDARGNLSINIPRQAARLACYAQFHAAQAVIFERTGKIAKTHKGVGKQFHRLAAAEPALPQGFAASLSSAYRYKEIADYETGADGVVAPGEALAAITSAERFVAVVRQVLAQSS